MKIAVSFSQFQCVYADDLQRQICRYIRKLSRSIFASHSKVFKTLSIKESPRYAP